MNRSAYQVEDARYRCFCGIHIRTAATLIGAFGAVIEFVSFFVILFTSISWKYKIFQLLATLLGVFVCALIVYSDRKEAAWAYTPYLLVTGIGLIFDAVVGLFALYVWIFEPNFITRHFPENEKAVSRFAIRIVIIVVVFEILGIWAWTIVYRAYLYMKNSVYTKPKFEVY